MTEYRNANPSGNPFSPFGPPLPGPNGLTFSTSFPYTDSFVLASAVMPGRWTLDPSSKKEFGWDVRQGYGLSGATVWPKGDPLVVATMNGVIWDSFDVLAYMEIRKQLLVKGTLEKGGISFGMGVFHPELEAMGVKTVVIQSVSPLTEIEEGGLWGATIELLQYRKPALTISKPSHEIPSVTPPTPTARDNADLEIQKLGDEAAGKITKLGGG